MIALRRASERHHEQQREQEAWSTFHRQTAPFADGFGALETLREGRVAPRAATWQPRQNSEIITYVRNGALTFEDSMGHAGVIGAGEFQRTTFGSGVRYSEMNASPTTWAHVFRIWLRPTLPGLGPGYEQKRFSTAERRGTLRIVASPDGRAGSLRVHQNAVLYSAILASGQHIVHELPSGRGAWLHIVEGAVNVGATDLSTGDGAGFNEEAAVSLTANDETELLLLDVDPAEPKPRLLEGHS